MIVINAEFYIVPEQKKQFLNNKKNEKPYSFGLPICKNTSMIDVSLRLVIL